MSGRRMENDVQHFGIAIFTDRHGQQMVYQLCNPMPTDPDTNVAEFKPRDFKEITVENHDRSGSYRYMAGPAVDLTEEDGEHENV